MEGFLLLHNLTLADSMANGQSEGYRDENGDFVCSRCSYHWKSRKKGILPKSCPSCRSTVWMKPYEKRFCERCGHEWGSSSESPRRCPLCGTYRWADTPTVYSCIRCGYKWNAKRSWPPKRCPSCRATTWNTEIVEVRNKKRLVSTTSAVSSDVRDDVSARYARGSSCTSISIAMGLSFNLVYTIIRSEYPEPLRV